MRLDELTLWLADDHMLMMGPFDGIRLMERNLTIEGSSLILMALSLRCPDRMMTLAFVRSRVDGEMAMEEIADAILQDRGLVDLRDYTRLPDDEEAKALRCEEEDLMKGEDIDNAEG